MTGDGDVCQDPNVSERCERTIVAVRRCAAAERSLVHRPSSLSFVDTAMVHR
jgi:hypothetical protein